MDLLQNIQFTYEEKEKFGFFMNLKLKLSFSLGEKGNWTINPDQAIETNKATYYLLKKKELENELNEKESIIKGIIPNDVYEKCLTTLRSEVATKYSKKAERTQFKDGKEIYYNPASFASEYPVILSTTFSSRGTIGQGTEFLFDYVIMDEASQVDVVTGALALSCAKNAVIVGDKMQLPNVIEEQKKKVVQERAEKYLGCDYNHSFYPDNGSFYCSQYIAEILLIFDSIPMKFNDEEKDVSDYWKTYYDELGVDVPVGVLGTNPSQLSKCEKIKLIGKLQRT